MKTAIKYQWDIAIQAPQCAASDEHESGTPRFTDEIFRFNNLINKRILELLKYLNINVSTYLGNLYAGCAILVNSMPRPKFSASEPLASKPLAFVLGVLAFLILGVSVRGLRNSSSTRLQHKRMCQNLSYHLARSYKSRWVLGQSFQSLNFYCDDFQRCEIVELP